LADLADNERSRKSIIPPREVLLSEYEVATVSGNTRDFIFLSEVGTEFTLVEATNWWDDELDDGTGYRERQESWWTDKGHKGQNNPDLLQVDEKRFVILDGWHRTALSLIHSLPYEALVLRKKT